MTTDASARARGNILHRLRAAPRPTVPDVDVEAYYKACGDASNDDPVGFFAAQARTWQAQVTITTAANWTGELKQILTAKGIKRCAAGSNTAIAADLADALSEQTVIWCDSQDQTARDQLFDAAEAGITTTLGGITQTGSLIVWPTTDEPRLLSLAPEIHIAVLSASQLYANWLEAQRAQQWTQAMPSNALLITGPSKTADIQRLLVYGAHGPRELVILLLRDA